MAIGSSLATLHIWSPNHYNGRKYPITKLTIHHVAGKLKAATIGNIFVNPSRKASSTYGIGYDGEIAQYVDEADSPWTSSNYDNDNRAITFEVSNSATGGDWPVSDAAIESLIKLCVDCVQRNHGIKEIDFTGDKTGNLTMHKWFAATACPGPYLESKFQYIADEINRRLGVAEKVEIPETPAEKPEATVLYRVQVGAYTKLENAIIQRNKVKDAGFQTYLIKADDGLYKVQTGAYAKYANAEAQVNKLKATGFNSFITTKGGAPADEGETEIPKKEELSVGDKVKLTADAKYSDGRNIPSWVFKKTLYARQFYTNGNVVISTLPIGAVTGVVERKYLTKI